MLDLPDERKTAQQLLTDLQQLRQWFVELEAWNQELLGEQNLLRLLLDHSPDRIYFKDRQGRYLRVSRSLAKLHGFSDPEQMQGHTDEEFYHPRYAQQTAAAEERILETGLPLIGHVEEEEFRNGRRRWVSMTKLPLPNLRDEVVGTFGIARDISDLQEVREALRDSQVLYSSLVESLIQNVYRKDMQGRLIFGNQQFCRTLGREWEDLEGKTDHDLFPREMADKYVEDDRRVIATGKPLEAVEEHQLADGRRIYVQVIKSPVYSAAGELIATQGLFWDVTEKYRAQEATAMLAAIVESSPDAIFSTDLDGKILTWNPNAEQLYGYPAAEAIGRPISVVVPPEEHDEFQAIRRRVIGGELIQNYETERMHKQGHRVAVALNASPVRDHSGAIVAVAVVARDLRERQDALHKAQQLAALVQSSPDAILGLKPDGTITSVNPAAEKLYGFSREVLLGEPISQLTPDDRTEEIVALIGRAMRGEHIDGHLSEQRTATGERVNVILCLAPLVSGLDTENQKITGLTFIARQRSC